MKLIVGLGNPGERYRNTRHNIGFSVVDDLAIAMNLPKWEENQKFEALLGDRTPVLLTKPQTFMNESGRSVKKLVRFYKIYIPDIIVIHDDLDIKLGSFKIEVGHGPKIHNGVNSIEEALGSEAFTRVRIGVDNRDPVVRTPGEEYVLSAFTEDENKVLEVVKKEILDQILTQIHSS